MVTNNVSSTTSYRPENETERQDRRLEAYLEAEQTAMAQIKPLMASYERALDKLSATVDQLSQQVLELDEHLRDQERLAKASLNGSQK